MQIIMEPTVPPLTRQQFRDKPRKSIAADGYVYGGPWFDADLLHANFNHHEEVDRLATRCSSAQVLMAMRQGLFHPDYLFGNDCDEDFSTLAYLLGHPHLVVGTMNPMVNRLVHVVDMLDCTAGSYPFPLDLPLLEELGWIMDPYKRFRLSGELDRKVASSYLGVVEDVGNRIGRYLVGAGGRVPMDPAAIKYTVLGGGRGWVLVHEDGPQAKIGIFADRNTTYVAVRERPQGGYTYVIGKLPFAPLSLAMAFKRLNEADGTTDSPDRWGGGDTIGGSPRVGGSKLTPEEVSKIINDLMPKA